MSAPDILPVSEPGLAQGHGVGRHQAAGQLSLRHKPRAAEGRGGQTCVKIEELKIVYHLMGAV